MKKIVTLLLFLLCSNGCFRWGSEIDHATATSPVRDVLPPVFNENGDLIATIGKNNVIKIWSGETGSLLFTLPLSKQPVESFLFGPNQQLLTQFV